jgi:serine/threonine-protein kinase
VQQSTVAVTAKAKSGLPIGLLIGALAVVLLAAAGAAYWFLRPAPVVPLGALELNATPFAEIVSVTSDKGKVVVLPAGDHWTPFRLDDVPLGRYTVGFRGPDGNTQQQQCDVAQSAQICTIELKPIDDSAIDQIVGATK